VSSGTPPPFRTQTFAIVSGLSDAPTLLRMLCEELSRLTNRIVIPQVLRSYPDLMQRIARGTVHIAWMPPLLANELWSATVAAVALCSVRSGKSSYHSVLFARRHGAVRTLADLTGRHMSWVDRNSAAGYVIPRLRLAAAGLDPETLFARESFHENHAQVARAVFSSEADAGATFAVFDPRTGRITRAGWEEAGIPLDNGLVLASAGPIPSDGIVLSAKLPLPLAAEMTAALAQLPRKSPHALRALFGVEDFAAPQTTHFDELRNLVLGARKVSA
jgi:phosphonate transport system substrate-binding protein